MLAIATVAVAIAFACTCLEVWTVAGYAKADERVLTALVVIGTVQAAILGCLLEKALP